MALLERVSALVRANLNDLIDRAEDPEKMLKQVILDMQNQLLQVKTQVAMAIADQHLLLKKQQEQEKNAGDWARKAELAVEKHQDDLARAALEKGLNFRRTAEAYTQQVADQTIQVENLKGALRRLETKLEEAQSKAQLLIAQHRRARAVGRAAEAGIKLSNKGPQSAFDRLQSKVQHSEALGQAKTELIEAGTEERFERLEKDDEVDRLLAELKSKKQQRLLES